MNHEDTCVLAIDPTTRGFGYAVFESPERLLDWGVASVRVEKQSGCLRRIAELLDRYMPDVVVLEHEAEDGSRRCRRVGRLLAATRKLAVAREVRVRTYGRGSIRAAFFQHGAFTKDQIAAAIAGRYPELVRRLPPVRKCWMPEDDRMAIFDAAALYLTFLEFEAKRKRPVAT